MSATECRICFGPHDREIHQATVAVHKYLRQRLAEGPGAGADAAAARDGRASELYRGHAAEEEQMRLRFYLSQLSFACIEASANPRLMPLVFALLLIAPGAIVELAGAGPEATSDIVKGVVAARIAAARRG